MRPIARVATLDLQVRLCTPPLPGRSVRLLRPTVSLVLSLLYLPWYRCQLVSVAVGKGLSSSVSLCVGTYALSRLAVLVSIYVSLRAWAVPVLHRTSSECTRAVGPPRDAESGPSFSASRLLDASLARLGHFERLRKKIK